MSKQTTANKIYSDNSGLTRSDIIQRIVNELGVSSAYASTLYNNARKANAAKNEPLEIKPTELPKIKKFDRPTLHMFRSELHAALAEVQDKFGVTIDMGSMSFSDHDFTTRLKVSLGDAGDAAEREWSQNCILFGLKKEDFGRSFTSNGTRFTVCGIKPRSRKFPVIAVNSNGTRYKFPASKLS